MPPESSARNRTSANLPAAFSAWAPGRVNLIGEHVDYNGGRCLPIALRQGTTARVSVTDDERVSFTSRGQSWSGTLADLDGLEGWTAYVGGVLGALGANRGLTIDIDSDLPIGAGLSSSAALECSVALAVDAVLGLERSGEELAEAAVRAETEYVGAPTGGLDQAIAMHGEEGHALLLDFTTGAREQVPFDPAAHGMTLLVIDTRVSHELTDGSYGSRREECDEAAQRLGIEHLAAATGTDGLPDELARRVRHVVSEVARVDDFVAALRADDWSALGPLLNASHASLRDEFEVSVEELDVTAQTALEAGAVGARMTGGGFGGSAIALVPSERAEAVRAAVNTAFVARGWMQPAFLTADPGPAAHLL